MVFICLNCFEKRLLGHECGIIISRSGSTFKELNKQFRFLFCKLVSLHINTFNVLMKVIVNKLLYNLLQFPLSFMKADLHIATLCATRWRQAYDT